MFGLSRAVFHKFQFNNQQQYTKKGNNTAVECIASQVLQDNMSGKDFFFIMDYYYNYVTNNA